ncbi:flagellar protein FliT [Vibrio fluminensis]|uniref:flagellar protein FliT n=1 Tax=Vibrio fluminensis TaxID=2783614 RepID=UPI0018881EFE|nr:flagellar protein FliT [Vibrio fluminensis]
MLLADSFQTKLTKLSDLDQLIVSGLNSDEINAEEISQLVDKREHLLQSALQLISQSPMLAQAEQWRTAINQTEQVVRLMQEKTHIIGQSLHKYRHGNKSVQQYKKFL